MSNTLSELKDKVKDRARVEDVAALRIRGMKRSGNYYKALCPFHADRTPSFFINTRTNRYRCYSCGANGDAIQFLMDIDGLSFNETVYQLAELYGLVETPGKPAILKRKQPPRPQLYGDEQADNQKEIEKARAFLKSSIPAHNTLAEIYLKTRGIDPAKLPAGVMVQLRFLPAVQYWHTPESKTAPKMLGEFPALIAPLQNHERAIQGVHITYLKPDGTGKIELRDNGKKLPAKKMKGKPWGCAIRLGMPAPLMVFAEGIENGLSSLIAKPDWPVWVGGSLGNLSGAGQNNAQGEPHPVYPSRKLPTVLPSFTRPGLLPPKECKLAILLAEQDAGDQYTVNALIERTLRRWKKMGIDARAAWSPVGKDHNDILREAVQ